MEEYMDWVVADVICPCGPSCVALGGGLPRCRGCGTRFAMTGSPYTHRAKISASRGPIKLTLAYSPRSIDGIPEVA